MGILKLKTNHDKEWSLPARVGFTARNHPSHQSRTSLWAPHLLWKAQWGWKQPSHGFVESRPQISHLGISWDAYDRITNPGCRNFWNGRLRGGVFLLSLPYGNSTVCEQEHRHFEEVNHRISLWFNSLLLKFIIYNRQIIMNHRIKWPFLSIFHNYVRCSKGHSNIIA